MAGGYDGIYEGLVPKLAFCDYRELARRLGLALLPEEDGVAVSFLGRHYRVTAAGVEPVDGKTAEVNNRSVLAYYVLSQGSGEPTGRFCLLPRLSGMVTGKSSLQWMNAPFDRVLQGEYERFCKACRKLGGYYEGEISAGRAWRFLVLPRIPVRVVFLAADEEFPTEVRFYYDAIAAEYLEFEVLAFLNACFVLALTDAVRD